MAGRQCAGATDAGRAFVSPAVLAIACDAASRSEIVLPLVQNDRLVGVLDLDSPSPARFDDRDRQGLAAAVERLLEASDLSRLHWQ